MNVFGSCLSNFKTELYVNFKQTCYLKCSLSITFAPRLNDWAKKYVSCCHMLNKTGLVGTVGNFVCYFLLFCVKEFMQNGFFGAILPPISDNCSF